MFSTTVLLKQFQGMGRRLTIFHEDSLHIRAGQKLRQAQGIARCGNEDGPIHDLPDWHFKDGTPAPESEKRLKWQYKRKKEKELIQQLWSEMEDDVKKGNWQQFY